MSVPNWIKLVLGNTLIFTMALVLGEVLLRLFGWGPYAAGSSTPAIQLDPPGHYFARDSLLGYHQKAGTYRVCLAEDYCFKTTHLAPNRRITQAAPNTLDSVPQVWVLGCSFTHGWALNDEDTYPWQLQSQLPEYQISNWGANGYGTIHAYFQLLRALEDTTQRPVLIVFNHADFHFYRNVRSFEMRRLYTEWNYLGDLYQPHAQLDSTGALQIVYSNAPHRPWRMARFSALVNYVQLRFEAYLDRRNKESAKAVTLVLLDAIRELCEQHQIPLIFTNIAYQPDFIEAYCAAHQIPFVDLALDLRQKENNNLPYDGHPSAKAAGSFARELAAFLRANGF